MMKKDNMCCLDVDTGLTQCMCYIGASGCFLLALFLFVMNYLVRNPLAVVFGIVAVCLGVLMLVTSRQ